MNARSGPVDAVFLDIGGVFHLPDHELVLEALRRAGAEADPDLLDRAHYVGVAALSAAPENEADQWRAYEEAYCREVGVPEERLTAAVAELDAAFGSPGMWSRLVPSSLEALKSLAATGVTLAVVSNSDGTLERRLRAEAICQVGAGSGVPVLIVIDSAVVGAAKPDPAIFRFALDATGSAPERTIHVGDTLSADVEGSRAAGLHAIHFDPYGVCGDSSHDHVGSLDEVTALVRTRQGGSDA